MKCIILIFLLVIANTACVSVAIKGTEPDKLKRSNAFAYEAPQNPFQLANSKDSDLSWISKNTANSISVFTSCSEDEPPLRSIRANSLQGLESIDVKEEQEIQISEREGLKSTVEGKIEGVPVLIEMIIFIKNSCSYQLSYIALKKNFNQEKTHFLTFVKNFKVQ